MQSWQCLAKNEVVPKVLTHMEVHLHRPSIRKTLLLSCNSPSFLYLGSKPSHLLLLLTKHLDPFMLHPHIICAKKHVY